MRQGVAATLTLAFILCAGICANAQALAGFTPADAADVRATVDRYFDAFSKRDFAAFNDLFQAPFLVFGAGGGQLIETVNEVVARWTRVRTALDDRDYARSSATDVRVTALDGARALANVRWQRFKRDGGVLDEGAEFYAVCKNSGRWKLCGNLGQSLAQFGKVF
jgi:hypothetical protein